MKINLISYFSIVCFLCLNIPVEIKAQEKSSGNFADGPYILYQPENEVRVISTDSAGVLNDIIMPEISENFSFPVSSHDGKHAFTVKLHAVSRPTWKYKQPGKVLVLSDPHGNLDCFVSVLRANNVIDEQYNWIYGKNHLMILGDVFDRGKDVLPIFWLIYKLEKEAEEVGGNVSFLLGNHETMILAGDLRYMDKMYHNLAESLHINYRELFAPSSELGRWIGTRNTIQVIGTDLYVHAGLGADFLQQNLTIPQVNEEMSRALFMTKQERNNLSPLTKFLYGSQGPIWYRGMVHNDEKYKPLHLNLLKSILQKYRVKRIFVGHTIFPDIVSFYNGRVIGVNVDNKKNFEKVLGRGVLIEKNRTYVIGDKERMRMLAY
ncbi:MAG: metallophosphoesterase [Bacteroides sp.]|nr:metallophosphoesterase [Bacteroides sp.]